MPLDYLPSMKRGRGEALTAMANRMLGEDSPKGIRPGYVIACAVPNSRVALHAGSCLELAYSYGGGTDFYPSPSPSPNIHDDLRK